MQILKSSHDAKVATGISHGTLGEIYQGPFIEGGKTEIAIISLPMKKYSWVSLDSTGKATEVEGIGRRYKSRKAIELYTGYHGLKSPSGTWSFRSELLQGKGMSSSTADIVAVIRCLDAYFNIESNTKVISSILKEIERSDSVFLNSYALYLSGKQKIIEVFSFSPSMYACFIDEGDAIETDSTQELLLKHYNDKASDYKSLLTSTLAAFKSGELGLICECSTQSAILSQAVMPKKFFDIVLKNKDKFKADGLVVAHTGSIIGYLFIKQPSIIEIGEMATFFYGLGHNCSFVSVGLN